MQARVVLRFSPAMARPCFLLLALLLVCGRFNSVSAQITNPIAHESQGFDPSNMFLRRRPDQDHEALPTIDEEKLANSQCPLDIELRWQTEVSSSIYATPLVADVDSDGRLDIVVPSFIHYLDVLEGTDGEKLPGWPSFHKSSTHSSPLFYDIDRDGEREILLPTYNGQILAFRHNGQLMLEKINIPRLRVKKDWFVGLDPDHVDHHHPDIHAPTIENSTVEAEVSPNLRQSESNHPTPNTNINVSGNISSGTSNDINHINNDSVNKIINDNYSTSSKLNTNFRLPSGNDVNFSSPHLYFLQANELEKLFGITFKEQDRVLHDGWSRWYKSLLESNRTLTPSETQHANTHILWVQRFIQNIYLKKQNVTQDLNSAVSGTTVSSANTIEVSNDTAVKSSTGRRLLQANEDKDESGEATVEKEGELDEDGDQSWRVFEDYKYDDEEENEEENEDEEEPLDDEYGNEYDDYFNERMWEEEEWNEETHLKEKDMVDVDSHILCTPVIADINKDGIDEMIIATSYFFDRDYYDDPAHQHELPEGLELGKYLAGAIVVVNLETMKVKWHVHLELTTDSTRYRAYIYSAPTVVDLDGDGHMEIVVGTSVGFIYVIDAFGKSRPGFPLQMGEIQGQVVVADVNDDSELEIVAVDTLGNVAAFSATGKLIWERHTGSLIAQGVTVGDVDGDGETDVVFGTTSGHVWVMNGRTGEDVHGFPYRTHGRIMAPILLVDLKKKANTRETGLHLALTSFDGYFYVIDGKTACANAIDIGETSYTMILADNVDGGNDLELIVTTMNGNIFCFQTPSVYHPLKAWGSQSQMNVFYPRYSNRGVYILPSSRQYRDINAKSFNFQFEIVDANSQFKATETKNSSKTSLTYSITIRMLMPGVNELIHHKDYDRPGVYTIQISSPLKRAHATILVEMVGPHMQHFTDEVSLTFHHNFYRLFKWILALPLLVMALTFFLKSMAMDRYHRVQLPSFTPSSR